VRSSPPARRLLLHLFSLRNGYLDEPIRIEPFTKPGACVSWITSGHGRLRINDAEWHVAPGPDFLFYGTDQPRQFIPAPSERLVNRAFWFGGPGLGGWLEELNVKRQPQFRLRHPGRIHAAYRAMWKLARRQPANWEWKIHLRLVTVLGEFLAARKLLTPRQPSLPPAIITVLNAVETDPARDWKTTELAEIVQMSYTAFRTQFSAALNESPHAYLQRVRLDLARELLADPSLRIKEIARRLHFSSAYYFSNFFHQHDGVTPTEFRAHLAVRGDPP